MKIELIKKHGALLGLEAEMNTRRTTLGNAIDKRNWTLVYSCAVFMQELAEELRKLNDELKLNDKTTPPNA